MDTDPMIPMIRAAKAALSVVLGSIAVTVAQVEWTDLSPIGNVVGVAGIALVVGRYTLRQLEDYRRDLRAARDRGDWYERKIDVHEERERRLITYTSRLERAAVAYGLPPAEMPSFPELPHVPPYPLERDPQPAVKA